ncbi:MAG: helix-turn-helix transcriptional regulator [Polyangiaceae bacterium]|nr:helix-turn-helix transcriptional regulator [Polyangiaceae bacterium]
MAKAAPKLTDRAPLGCCPEPAKLRPEATRPYARLFKALGDETRLEMLALLAAAGAEMCVCNIEEHFDLSQPTISHHLKILREARLVTAERRGTWVYYSLDRGTIRLVEELCARLLR